jgi:hypothetical protein
MNSGNTHRPPTESKWVRIPNGTKVRHRRDAYDGFIDGLTEIVVGPERNPDGKTQYRVNIGGGIRQLVSEEHLNILIDQDDLVLIGKEKEPYRRLMTVHLRGSFGSDRFIRKE